MNVGASNYVRERSRSLGANRAIRLAAPQSGLYITDREWPKLLLLRTM